MRKRTGKNTGNNPANDEFARHTNVLLEKMDATVKTVTEQYGGIIKRIDTMADDVTELKVGMSIVRPAVEQLVKDMKEVKSELSSVKFAVMDVADTSKDHEKRIEKVEEKVRA
jgi:methyl-accepting chemotaxis protein